MNQQKIPNSISLFEAYQNLVTDPEKIYRIYVNGQIEKFMSRSRPAILSGKFNPLHDGHRSIFNHIIKPLHNSSFFHFSIRLLDGSYLSYENFKQVADQFLKYASVLITNTSDIIEMGGVIIKNIYYDPRFYLGFDDATDLINRYGMKLFNIRNSFSVLPRNKMTKDDLPLPFREKFITASSRYKSVLLPDISGEEFRKQGKGIY